jgi:hypothetical protein
MSLGTILLIVLVLLLIEALPSWPYSSLGVQLPLAFFGLSWF